MKPLNIGMVGYGFMGRTHSNGYAKANHFFDLEYKPVLKAVCARSKDKAQAFADQWGYESVETDWRELIKRDDIDAIDVCTPNNLHKEISIAAAEAGKMVLCEKPLAMDAEDGEEMCQAVEKAGVRQHGLVQLSPRTRCHPGQAADRRRSNSARSFTTAPTSCKTGRSTRTFPRAERRPGVWMPMRREAA